MESYSPIESAVVQRLIDHFPDELSANRCRAADIDTIFQFMQSEDADYGCIIDYGDGQRQRRPTFNADIWVWQIIGFFFVRFRGDQVEQDQKARRVIDRLVTLFSNDKRLGGLVAAINVTQISQPEPEKINEVPLYWIPFSIEAIDK